MPMQKWLISAAWLLFFATSPIASSQIQSDAVNVSISTNESTFGRKSQNRIRVKVINQSAKSVKFDGHRFGQITLERTPRSYRDCHITDCFGANFVLDQRRRIGPGESFEFDIDLTALHWHDSILSGLSLRKPKNFFQEVPSGNYQLLIDLWFTAYNPTTKTTHRISLASNALVVTIKGGS